VKHIQAKRARQYGLSLYGLGGKQNVFKEKEVFE